MKYIQLDQCLHCRTSRASLNSSAAALLSNATPHVISPTFFEHRVFSFLELFQHLLESENLGESTRETALNDKVWELEDSYQRKQNAYPQDPSALRSGSPGRISSQSSTASHLFPPHFLILNGTMTLFPRYYIHSISSTHILLCKLTCEGEGGHLRGGRASESSCVRMSHVTPSSFSRMSSSHCPGFLC